MPAHSVQSEYVCRATLEGGYVFAVIGTQSDEAKNVFNAGSWSKDLFPALASRVLIWYDLVQVRRFLDHHLRTATAHCEARKVVISIGTW